MTTAHHAEISPRSVDGQGHGVAVGATRADDWTYTGWTPQKGPTLRNEGRGVDLHYSSSILEGFLEEMDRIQSEFCRRSPDIGPSEIAVGEYSGETSCV